MTLTEARKILGLGPDDDPRPHLAEFKSARERIAAMVRSAPNEALALRYQQGLIEFDQALAAVREYLEAIGLAKPTEVILSDPPPVAAVPELEPEVEPPESESVSNGGGKSSFLVWFLVIALGIAGGAWFYLKYEENREFERQTRIAFLERQGAAFIENRSWPEAITAFNEIEALSPGSDLARQGRRSIEAGMAEEQTQFIAYWTGEARAAFEAARWDDAEKAARQVLEKFPTEADASELLESITSGRSAEFRKQSLADVREKIDLREWDAAIAAADSLIAKNPTDPEAIALKTDALKAREKAAADLIRARDLLKLALTRDQGRFDNQVMEWLREASILAPQDQEIAAALEKMASYTRTLRVPGDFATPAEALAEARDRDRILLGEGEWEGPLLVNAAVEIQGSGPAKTLVSCDAETGSVITIGPAAKGVRISGVTFRHRTFEAEEDRYSTGLVRGGSATFLDCRFLEASGHGLVVIEGGHAEATRCRFAENGWNGVSATGAGSTLEVRESESISNFGHGMESWDRAAVVFIKNRCHENSRNGIHIDNGASSATLEGNTLSSNREFGLVISSAAGGGASANIIRGNLLGGAVVRAAASGFAVNGNEITSNQGSGLILETGLIPDTYKQNSVTRNAAKQVLSSVNLTFADEIPSQSASTNAPSIRVELPPPLEEP